MPLQYKTETPCKVSPLGGYFPVMHKLGDGSLVLTAFDGEDRVCNPNERSLIFAHEQRKFRQSSDFISERHLNNYPYSISWQVKSSDGGLSWHPYGGPVQASGVVLNDGSSLFIPMITNKEPNQYKGSSFEIAKALVWRTNYDGSVWDGPDEALVSGPRTRDSSKFDSYNYVGFTRSIIECPDGTLLASANTMFEDDSLFRTAIYRSKDRGNSFVYYSTVALHQGSTESMNGRFEGFDEPVMSFAADGRLLCIMRTGSYSPLYQSWSSDFGATWTKPVPLGADGVFPTLCRLSDGTMVLSSGRPDVFLLTMQQDGRWDNRHVVYASVRATGFADDISINDRSCCYTSMAEVEPGVVVLTFSAPDDIDDTTINNPWNPVERKHFRIYSVRIHIQSN